MHKAFPRFAGLSAVTGQLYTIHDTAWDANYYILWWMLWRHNRLDRSTAWTCNLSTLHSLSSLL